MSWTVWLHPLLMLLVVFPVGFAAAAFGLQLQQARTGSKKRKSALPEVRRRHITSGSIFVVALLVVATVGGFVSTTLPAGADTGWHGLGALVVVLLLVVSTALVSVRALKRQKWSRLTHAVLNGTVMGLLVLQFLSGGWIIRQLLQG